MRFTLVLIAILASLALSGCSRPAPATSHASAPPPSEPGVTVLPENSPKLARIRVEPVKTAQFPSDEVLAPGKIEANPNRISRVVMPVAGRIRQVLARLGDSVTQGQPLLTVDSPDAGAAMTAYRQAQSQARQARSTLAKAEKDLARLRELHQHRAAALKDVLAAENDVAQAQAAVEQSQAAGDDAVHRLDLLGLKPGAALEVAVRAPIPGKVLEIAVVPGEYRNDTNAPLLTIADLSTVWISADVPESAIRKVQRGELIEVELSAYPGELHRGRVMRIADTVDPQTRAIKVQAEIANPGGRLRPEMFGQIRHNHGLIALPAVPASAVLQVGDSPVVLAERSPGRFERMTVKTGPARNGMVPLMSGVDAGQRVVVDGAILLKSW